MSNIEGGPFEPYVKKQIETRQKALGQGINEGFKFKILYN